MPPTSIETLALAVCTGEFQETTPVLVTVVPMARFGSIIALNRSTMASPGCNGPLTAE